MSGVDVRWTVSGGGSQVLIAKQDGAPTQVIHDVTRQSQRGRFNEAGASLIEVSASNEAIPGQHTVLIGEILGSSEPLAIVDVYIVDDDLIGSSCID